MNGTIRDNIAFGFKNNQIEDKSLVKKCLKQAQLLDFVESQPEGLDFKIEENGLNLEWPKQRISIARTFYKKPKILILDEATSSLDNINENEIKKQLQILEIDIQLL